MHGSLLLGLFLVAALAGPFGCMGAPVPLSAQAGSTITIPLGSPNVLPGVGYGGTEAPDPQRGSFVYRLETPSGPFALVTRASGLATPHSQAPLARGRPLFLQVDPSQVVSIVDIPADAPLGTYDVSVTREFVDPVTFETQSEAIDYPFQLSILPNTVEVLRDDGSTEVLAAEFNEFESFNGSGFNNLSDLGFVPFAIPDPAFRVSFDRTDIWAAELHVSYPANVINVTDVFETTTERVEGRAIAWRQDDGTGTLILSATSVSTALTGLSVVFVLDDPSSAILNPADLTVTVMKAWNKDGSQIGATASMVGIF